MLSLQCDVNTAERLQALRGRNELCDVVIVSSDGQQTFAHSCVLACHSSVIATVLESRLAAQHDWSILRPLVINIDEVKMKNSHQQEIAEDVNVMEVLISLMYGEIVNVADIHVPALNECAHILGLSDQIFTSLDGHEGKKSQLVHCDENINNERCNRKSVLSVDSQKKSSGDENEHIEELNDISLDNQIFPTGLSKSTQEKQSTHGIEAFNGKDHPENLLSFSMLCAESQDDDDSSSSKNWNEGDVSYEKDPSSVQSQDTNVIVCKMEQSGHEESVGGHIAEMAKDNSRDGNTCNITSNTSDLLNMTVNAQTALTNTYCGETHQLQQQQRKQAKKSLICTACGSAFQKCGDLVKHVQNVQHFTVQCPLCFIQVEDLEGQRLHFALHDQELPFFCVYCDLRFRTRAALTMHTPKHMTSKPFVCNDCGRGFKWRHALHAHLYTHSPTSRLLCDICGFSSKYVTSFKAHLLQHSGQSFPCPHPGCSFTSNRKTHLNDHLATHSKTRVHQCEVCGHSFSHARNMRRHMRLHAPASNLLTCVSLSKLQCTFRTTRPDKLRDHLFRKHNLKHDTLPSKHISKLFKSSTVLTSNPSKLFEKQPLSTFSNQDNLQLTSPRNFRSVVSSPKAKCLPVIEKFNKNSVEVGNIVNTADKLCFQKSCDIYDVKKSNQNSKVESSGNIKSGNKVIFQPSQHPVKDNGCESAVEKTFSVLISSSGIAELPQIQTLQSHTGQSMKAPQGVSEITDNFQSGFLIEHDILLEKAESTSISESCLSTKGDITLIQTSVLPVSNEKVIPVNASVDHHHLSLVGTSNVNSLSYSSHCTLSESQDNVVLEVGESSEVELPSTSSVQVSVSNPVGESNFQEKPVKEEQCMESLTILEFMLDNVTS